MADKSIQVKQDIGTQVIDRVNALCEAGFTMPKDYNYVNAIKSSMLALADVVDRNKKPALEVCTQKSIQSALFEMCTKGLDVSKKQAYFIVRGDKLCLHVSYFGHLLQTRRLFPNWSPIANTIRQGDEFIFMIDPKTGRKQLVKHEQKLENLDNDFVGAYMYLPCIDGTQELYVMTKKQILKAWSKSSSNTLQTHKDFDEKMALKTIINSGCTKAINATPDLSNIGVEYDDDPNNVYDPVEGKRMEAFDEADEVSDEKKQIELKTMTENGEAPVVEQTTEQANPAQEDDEF